MKNLILALLNLAKMTYADLVVTANGIYAGLNQNPAYTNPPVAMTVLRTTIDEFTAAITAALTGGLVAVQQRNDLADTLKGMLRQLAHYVEATSNGNMTTFLSSGFKAASAVRILAPPVSELFRSIVHGSVSGQMLIVLMSLASAYSYEVRWAPVPAGGVPATWTSQGFGTTRGTISGLTSATTYAFQARTLTSAGYSDWSDTVTRVAV